MTETQLEELVPVDIAVPEAPAENPQTELAALTALVAQLREDTARQCEYQKKQLCLTRLFAGICGVVLAAVLCLCIAVVPRMSATLASVDDLMVQAQSVAVNLEHVSTQLADTDIAAMLQNVDGLVTQSQAGITEALGNVQDALAIIESFDIESLNKSIQDLQSIISPLANLLGR